MNSRDKIKVILKEAEDYEKLIKSGIDEKVLSAFSAHDSKLHEMPTKSPERILQYVMLKSRLARYSASLYQRTHNRAVYDAFMHRAKEVCAIGDIARKWAEEKNYLLFTKELTSVLVDSMEDEDFSVPAEDLKHLPYKTFFLDTAKDELVNNYVLDNMLGCFVNLRNPDRRYSCEYLSVAMLFVEEGSLKVFHVDVPLEKDITIGSICDIIKKECGNDDKEVNEALTEMCNIDTTLRSQFDERVNAVQTARIFIAKQIIPQLLYLSAKEPEIKYVGNNSHQNKSQSTNTSTGKGVNKGIVGSEFALKYCKFIDEYKRNSGSSKGGDEVVRTMPPHLRRAHYHRHWVGSDENPGKNGPRRLVRMWQEPTFVHAEYKDLIEPVVKVVDKKLSDNTSEKTENNQPDNDFGENFNSEYEYPEEIDDR